LIGVVANMHPALERARLAKGTLKALGLPDVPVAVGTDGGCTVHDDKVCGRSIELASSVPVPRYRVVCCSRLVFDAATPVYRVGKGLPR
jgi:hypothetical protein